MSEGKVVKCPICGEPYIIAMYTTANRSACPKCVRRAEKNSENGGTYPPKPTRFSGNDTPAD